MPIRPAVESCHLERNRDLSTELERLVEGAAGKCHARDAGRKAEIVLNPRRSARLSAECTLVEHEDRKALGRSIDSGGKPRRPGADHRYIEDHLWIKLGGDAENDPGLSVRGSFQHRSIRTNHQRQLVREYAETFHHGAAVGVIRGIEHRVGIAVATEKTFKPDELRCARLANQHRADAALLDESDATKDERSHENLANIGRADHQGAHMGGIERQRGTALGTRAAGSEHPGPGELAYLARELTGAMASDRRLTIETITTYNVNRALEHEPSRRVALARLENDFARGEISRRAARKALGCLDLRSIDHGQHLVMACLDEAHARSPVGIVTPQAHVCGAAKPGLCSLAPEVSALNMPNQPDLAVALYACLLLVKFLSGPPSTRPGA